MKSDAELAQLKAFYDDVYYANEAKKTENLKHLKALAERLGIKKGDAVLDVACGLGGWLRVCSSMGAKVAGVDLSSKAIGFCKNALPEGEFFAQPAETLPFPDAQFDYVTCLGSLEHFVEPKNALREMQRVAKPGAEFILLVPNKDFLTRKLKLYFGTNQKDAKEVVRTLPEWTALFEGAGLEVRERWKDLHVFSSQWIFLNGWAQAPLRLFQAIALLFWPLSWQYQVYHSCVAQSSGNVSTAAT